MFILCASVSFFMLDPWGIPRSKLLQALARRGSMKVKAFVLYAAEVKEEHQGAKRKYIGNTAMQDQ